MYGKGGVNSRSIKIPIGMVMKLCAEFFVLQEFVLSGLNSVLLNLLLVGETDDIALTEGL